MIGRFPYPGVEAAPSPADPVPFLWRPVVPITLRGLGKTFHTEALADTGASETVLPMRIRGRVGPRFRPDEIGRLEEPNGTEIAVRYAKVDLEIKLGRHRLRWEAKVAFTPDRDEAVLGDAGCFRYFRVTFHRPGRVLTIQVAAPLPPSIAPFGL